MLYNHTVPPDGGGDTMFASMYAAYDALSPRMKAYLSGLTATHDGKRVFGPTAPEAVHPVIIKHPVSGKKVIYVNTDFTAKIDELPVLEGERVLKFLIDHCNKPEWTCRFRWRAHSIAFWDNRCTHHKAIWDYWPNIRSGAIENPGRGHGRSRSGLVRPPLAGGRGLRRSIHLHLHRAAGADEEAPRFRRRRFQRRRA